MKPELDTSTISENTDDQNIKMSTDYLIKNEPLEKYLNFYSSQNEYHDKTENGMGNIKSSIEIPNDINIGSNILNTIKFNDTNEDDLYTGFGKNEIENLRSIKNIMYNDYFGSITPHNKFGEEIDESDNPLNLEQKIELCNNMDYYKRKESQTEDKFYKKNEQRYAEKIRDDSLIISDRELIQSIGKEDKQILWSSEKASLFFNKNILRDPNENSNKGISTPSNLQKVDIIKNEKNEISCAEYNECALTHDFFETIENLNTKVFEKYNKLKEVSENLINIINTSDFEKRINNLLKLSDSNSELIDQFKKKSEECIRKCSQFETTSENLMGECINTMAYSSICYGEWMCLHSYEIDSIYKDLDNLKEFVQIN
ncbi:conserved Plasmodium protein, unknown function [Plasmodium berghei]|uniref:Uncharacterized protein n=2 Tax=Plasmodium berghei TaxID=5821 RepID=A0A509ALP9_PLABA|nr:conserved Plasmodium protein, unknown function [Plasmodium berghei ANKA]CXI61057.1 conserved Plasmodium protein, unknown function [Plasmodium berghei]SCM23615.1 conserved Plasmodium protein, unknown function [Plasmodium berghei]SCN26686.1 conserved Plasmodium protein, unknown function [Plasmodium berghei]SCO60969.1 conserved Plasmodium protein, unknown function [Plasmodium berghei]SCO63042.1 conserved Plasmodium protein, unknown function [Plasmodium berghei]|eukprot:XP_034422302.1 conserved Plasmodium protein, unknown function [Plasmodium berghei ANKA]